MLIERRSWIEVGIDRMEVWRLAAIASIFAFLSAAASAEDAAPRPDKPARHHVKTRAPKPSAGFDAPGDFRPAKGGGRFRAKNLPSGRSDGRSFLHLQVARLHAPNDPYEHVRELTPGARATLSWAASGSDSSPSATPPVGSAASGSSRLDEERQWTTSRAPRLGFARARARGLPRSRVWLRAVSGRPVDA